MGNILLKTGTPGRRVGLALLVMGLAIGAGLVLTVNYTYDVLTARTITTTWTETSIVVITIPTVISSTTVYAQIGASVTSCQWNGSHEYCEVTLNNSGSLGTASSGNCSLSYGGHAYAGYTGPTQASAAPPGAPQQLIPGGSATTFCQAATGGAAGSGVKVNGSILLADGVYVLFSANASS